MTEEVKNEEVATVKKTRGPRTPTKLTAVIHAQEILDAVAAGENIVPKHVIEVFKGKMKKDPAASRVASMAKTKALREEAQKAMLEGRELPEAVGATVDEDAVPEGCVLVEFERPVQFTKTYLVVSKDNPQDVSNILRVCDDLDEVAELYRSNDFVIFPVNRETIG